MAWRRLSGIIAAMTLLRVMMFLCLAVSVLNVRAQTPNETPAEATEAVVAMPAELPVEALRLLDDVKDNVFSFDDPGFYWVCRFVAEGGVVEATAAPADQPLPWRHLLERPGDYRGRRVAIEGLVQRKSEYDLTNRPGLARLYQLDLGEADSRAIATVVLTRAPGELATHARVRADGYFIKVRAFQTNKGEPGSGPLLVGYRCDVLPGPTDAIPGYPPDQSGTLRLLYWGIAVLAVVWFVLRGHLRRQRDRQIVIKRGDNQGDATTEEDLRWLLDREGRDLLE